MSPTLSCSKSFHRKNPANPTATITAVFSLRQFSSASRFRMIFAVSCFFSGSFLLGWWASLLFAEVTTSSVMSPAGGGTHAFLCAHAIAATAFTTGLAVSALPRRSTRYVTAISVAGRALNLFSLAHVLHWLNAVLYHFMVDSACVSIALFFTFSLSQTSPLASAASGSSFHFFLLKNIWSRTAALVNLHNSPRELDPPPPASHCMSLQGYAFDFPSDLQPPFTILRGRSVELLNTTLLCYFPFLLN